MLYSVRFPAIYTDFLTCSPCEKQAGLSYSQSSLFVPREKDAEKIQHKA